MRVIVAGRLSRKAEDRDQTGFDSQERESVRWAEQNGHQVVTVVADFKSGRSGLDKRPNLRSWVTDPEKIAQYDAIVALKVDRLTRGNREETAELEQWARDNRKQLIIASAGVQFPSEGRDGIAWDMYLRLAHDEWLSISERYRRMQRTLREDGSVVGRAPWGFRIVKDGSRKTLVPTDDGANYVPLIFQWVIDGLSLRDVARRLDAAGVKTTDGGPWNEAFIGNRLIRNPTYYGKRPNSGNLEVQPLVSLMTWKEAHAVLAARVRNIQRVRRNEKPLVSKLVCAACLSQPRQGCPSGKSPMYRVFAGGGIAYYRCTGHGPQRKGCGAPMLRVADVEMVVKDTMYEDDRPHVDRTFIAGDDVAEQVAKLRTQLDSASTRAESNALWDEIERLESADHVAPHWEDTETDQTEAAYFASLSYGAQRKHLASKFITAEMDENGHPFIRIVSR
jgi:DNA invertase Pin-like site-specific DNA recombinase